MSHSLVPVLLGDSVEGGEYQRQDDLTVLLYQTEDVFVVPEVKSPLRYLKQTHRQKSYCYQAYHSPSCLFFNVRARADVFR